MTKIKDILQQLETFAPRAYQEEYDNSGLITGDANADLRGVLISLDCTEEIVEEAIKKNCNLIVSHHPIVFRGLKKITGSNYIERTIIKAIKNDIAIFAVHTNLDNMSHGVNKKIANKLGLINTKILRTKHSTLNKLTTFVPKANTGSVLAKLHEAGAGMIGDYKNCSFRTEGTGTFLPTKNTNPTIGETNQLENVSEDRIELIFPKHLERKVLKALFASHPYEEVAYYIHQLENSNTEIGSGMIGELPEPIDAHKLMKYIKKSMDTKMVRHTALVKNEIRKIALCGGAGSFLLGDAINQQADVFISGDFKYHEFFDAEQQIVIADVGHYESEQFTKELIYEYISEKFANIALHLTEVNTNPIFYA